jgi:hypothetical protein
MDRREKKREKLRCADNKRQKLSPWLQTDTNRAIQREREREREREKRSRQADREGTDHRDATKTGAKR